MKREKIDGGRERRVLTALITSTPFLARAAEKVDLQLAKSPHYRQVAEWCLSYFEEYGEAPGEHIETLYYSWSESCEDELLVQGVHDFLESLSDGYEPVQANVEYLFDELIALQHKQSLQKLHDNLEEQLSRGDLQEALDAVQNFRVIEGHVAQGINPLQEEEWEGIYDAGMEPLISFEGDAGVFFNAALTRDSLVGVQAPEKTGKTMWCIEFVVRALRQRRKVAFFQVGDLSQKQVMMRLGVRFSGLPMWPSQLNNLQLPTDISFEVGEEEEGDRRRRAYSVEVEHLEVPNVVNEEEARRGIRRFRRACGIAEESNYFRVSTHSNSSISVGGIESILDTWLQEDDFVPDVIVIDYADILAAEAGRKHEHDRNVTNDTWKALRRMTQERHVLGIVPTQANAKAYKQNLQGMDSFSEDKRKLAHVTAMLALNQTPDEKEIQGMRLNWIVLREAPYSINRPLYVGTCYALARALCTAKLG